MLFDLKKTLNKVTKSYNSYSTLRSEINQFTDFARQNSKKAIFFLMKEKVDEAKKALDTAKTNLEKCDSLFKKEKLLQESGAYKTAVEEYLEAKLFECYLSEKMTFDIFNFPLPAETILGAISDFTGELVRKSILFATEGKKSKIVKIKTVIEEVVLALTDIELGSGGYLRTKIDQVDKNLRKVEEILYSVAR